MKNNYILVRLAASSSISCNYCHVRNLCENGNIDEIGDENNISDVIDLIYLCKENQYNTVMIVGAMKEYLDCRGPNGNVYSIISRAVERFFELSNSINITKDELIKYFLDSKSYEEVKEKIKRKFLSIGVELNYIED